VEIVSRALPNGDTVRFHLQSFHGKTISETQVNDNGLFNGTQLAWHMFTNNKSKEGVWRNGFWNGEWRFWDTKGQLIEIVEYDMGKPIRYQRLVDAEMREVPYAQWPRSRKLIAQDKPHGVKDYPGQKIDFNKHENRSDPTEARDGVSAARDL